MPLTPNLTQPEARDSLIARVRSLHPDSPRQWGKMTVSQMLWHVSEAYRVALGDAEERDQSNWFMRHIVRRLAFHTPMPWPKNGPTLPRFDAVRRSLVVDAAFTAQQEEVVALVGRFAAARDALRPHPAFGPLSYEEWQHWGWRHTDHHLRQFGA